ncbi:hypothetical protein AB0N09_36265 [Streptomyces erythrochromogenes]|uniref:hypothetical protein n=1 Tax=Streptomyces erythrochromogenes TaxID=285574 RepID=UPI003425F25D
MENGFTAARQAFDLPELPEEIWGEIGRCLSMTDLANLALVNEEFHGRFWGGIAVHDQDELDQALRLHGVWFIVIESGGLIVSVPQVQGTPVIAANDVTVVAGRVHVRDSVHVTATGDAQICADGRGQVTADGQAMVSAHDQATVTAHGQARVTAHHQATVLAQGRARVTAHDRTTVLADGQAQVTAHDQATVLAQGRARVTAHDRTTVTLRDGATVTTHGRARVTYA